MCTVRKHIISFAYRYLNVQCSSIEPNGQRERKTQKKKILEIKNNIHFKYVIEMNNFEYAGIRF